MNRLKIASIAAVWAAGSLAFGEGDMNTLAGKALENRKEDKIYIWMEVEDGVDTSRNALEIIDDPEASGGKYVKEPDGYVRVSFEVTEPGAYRLYGRFFSIDFDNDSFALRFVDSAGQELANDAWNNINVESHLKWDWDVLKLGVESTDEIAEFELQPGTYSFEITPRDANEIKMDRFVLTTDWNFDGAKQAEGFAYIDIELETGEVLPPFSVFESDTASQGRYAAMQSSNAIYRVEVKEAGEYRIWGYVHGANHHSDSIFLHINDMPIMKAWAFAEDEAWGIWKWSAFSVDGSDVFPFHEGENVISLIQRETDSSIDAILVTNDLDFVPVPLR